MADIIYKGEQYRLRAGAPMPVGGRRFILHTFMAEKNIVDYVMYTETLPGSSQFRGQGGHYMSASFSRLPDIGGKSFSGTIIHEPTYVSEDSL
jgi:hypothetical protein